MTNIRKTLHKTVDRRTNHSLFKVLHRKNPNDGNMEAISKVRNVNEMNSEKQNTRESSPLMKMPLP